MPRRRAPARRARHAADHADRRRGLHAQGLARSSSRRSRDAGIHCGIQTGARALTEERIRAAIEAGLGTLGVSIDGPRDIHDRQRGVKGSYDHALRALRFANAAGIKPGVNTQINALSKPHLREIFDTIVEHGARLLAGADHGGDGQRGRQRRAAAAAARNSRDARHCSPSCSSAAAQIGFRLIPGNNIGYFGPHEYMWRTITSEPEHWAGLHGGREQPRARSRRQDQGLPVAAGGSLRRRQRRATVSIREAMAAHGADHDADSTARRPADFAAPAITGTLPRRLHLGDARARREARRQSILSLSRARTGEEGPARAHREGRGGARRAVRFRTLRHRRGRCERPSAYPANSRATTRSARADASSSSAPAATNSSSHPNASARIAARRIGRSANPPRPHPSPRCSRSSMKSTRMHGAFTNLSTDRRCRPARGPHSPANSREENMASKHVPTMPRSAMR